MDKVDILFVRACKSDKPQLKVNKLYERFYLLSSEKEKQNVEIMKILAEIVEASNPFSVIESIQLAKDVQEEQIENFYDFMIKKLINRICNTKVSQFSDFIPPRRFK